MSASGTIPHPSTHSRHHLTSYSRQPSLSLSSPTKRTQCVVKLWAMAAPATHMHALSYQPYAVFFTFVPSMPRPALPYARQTRLATPSLVPSYSLTNNNVVLPVIHQKALRPYLVLHCPFSTRNASPTRAHVFLSRNAPMDKLSPHHPFFGSKKRSLRAFLFLNLAQQSFFGFPTLSRSKYQVFKGPTHSTLINSSNPTHPWWQSGGCHLPLVWGS
jgi:hypothetical protein